MNLKYDPYVLGKNYFDATEKFELWPTVSFPNIYTFLINYPSIYTHKSLAAYKSLEAYKYVTSGLISDVYVKKLISEHVSFLVYVQSETWSNYVF